jgi:hypothetical protein
MTTEPLPSDDTPPRTLPAMRWPWLSGLVLLAVRGVLLWVLVPFAAIWWVAGWPLWHRRGVRLGQLIGWCDLNLIAAIQRSMLRPFTRSPAPWAPLKALPAVVHRVNLSDPA